jgi:hypothetical protein
MSVVVRRNNTAVVDNSFLEAFLKLVRRTFHGQVILVTQNYRVVQVECRENFNPEEVLRDDIGLDLESFKPKAVKEKIVQALRGLEFGQVVLIVKKGRLFQIERHSKERFADPQQGLAGDGI